MALHGNLKDFAATEILQLLASQKKSGCLKLESGGARRSFFVTEGRLVAARMPGLSEQDTLLGLLVKAGRLSAEQVQGIRAIHAESGRDLEDLIVNGRYLEPEDLAAYVERQILDELMTCVQWSSGTYLFEPGEGWPNTAIVKLSIEAAVIEAARRVDEHKRHLSVFGDPRMVLTVHDLPDPDDTVGDDELEMFELVDGRKTITDIIAAAPMLEYETYEALHRMYEAGWVMVQGGPPPAAPAQTKARMTTPIQGAKRHSPRRGVLVKELAMAGLVVVAVLGARFATAALHPAMPQAADDPFVTSQLHDLEYALDLYFEDRGRYPEQLEELVAGWWLPEHRLQFPGRTLRYERYPDGDTYMLELE